MKPKATTNDQRFVRGGILVAFLALELLLIGQKVGDVRLEPDLPPWMSQTEIAVGVSKPHEPGRAGPQAPRVGDSQSSSTKLRRVTHAEVDTDDRLLKVRSSLRLDAFVFDVGHDLLRVKFST